MRVHEAMSPSVIERFLTEGASSWEDIAESTATPQSTTPAAGAVEIQGGPDPLTPTESLGATTQVDPLINHGPPPASSENATIETTAAPTSHLTQAMTHVHSPVGLARQSLMPIPDALIEASIATLRECIPALQYSFHLNAENGAFTNMVLRAMSTPFLCPMQICPWCGEWAAKTNIGSPRCDGMRCERCLGHYCHFCGESGSVADYQSD